MQQKATFGAGCFWGVEQTFRRVPGVVATAVGYSGGTTVNPTYEDVCTDRTGHAEVVEIAFDTERVSYEKLLEVFFECHDPTTPNRQGPDVGSQYRSVVFFHNAAQEITAIAVRDRLQRSGRYDRAIVTQVVVAAPFFRAEEYHQRYFEKRSSGQCHV
jgi:peptide-methionine (S)-S-oxide reductase